MVCNVVMSSANDGRHVDLIFPAVLLVFKGLVVMREDFSSEEGYPQAPALMDDVHAFLLSISSVFIF